MLRLLRSPSPNGTRRSTKPSPINVLRYAVMLVGEMPARSAISFDLLAPPAIARRTEPYAAGSLNSCRMSMAGSSNMIPDRSKNSAAMFSM